MVEIEKPRITCFDSAEDPSYGKYVGTLTFTITTA